MKKKVGVKKTEKSVREKALPPVKKPEKTSKLVFTGTFYFHGEKKTLPQSGGRLVSFWCPTRPSADSDTD